MLRITLTLTRPRRRAAAAVPLILVLALAFALSGSARAPAARAGEPAAVRSAAVAPTQPAGLRRHFYVTAHKVPADGVLSACAPGYHAASIWEILDVSNLTYDAAHPAAFTRADSGYGPPSAWYGWVRTGYVSSASATAGTGNCYAWTSTAKGVYGTAVGLPYAWEIAPGDMSTWDATPAACAATGPVWCVGEFNAIYLPVVLRSAQ